MDSYNLTPQDVANWFLCNIDREAGDSITHLKLQKLIYYAQAWTLVINGKSLFADDFQAWAHGPVIEDIYQQYKGYGFEAIPSCECENAITAEIEGVLRQVNEIYGQKTAKFLENLTHVEDPWVAARCGLPTEARCNNIISKESMVEYYSKFLN